MSGAKFYVNPRQTSRPASEMITSSCILPIERFDHRRGLTSLQIHQTICSQDGRIWSATPAGLACYDGVTVNMFGHRQGLSSHGLRTLALHSDNALWIGSDVGLEVLDISASEPKVLWAAPIGTVNCIDIVPGFAVIGTSAGLFICRDGQKIYRSKDNILAYATITSVLISNDENVWAVGPVIGVVGLTKTEEKRNIPQRGRIIGTPLRLAHGSDGSVLIGAEFGILNVEDTAEIRQFFAHDKPVTALIYDDGKILASAGKNIIRIDTYGQSPQKYDVIHEDVVAHHIMIDHFENIWISSGDQSLLRINGISRTLSGNYNLDIGPIMCVRIGTEGLLVGGSRGLRLENGTVILDWLGVWDVLVDDYGKVWAATDQGLYCMVNPYFTIPYRHDESDVVAAPCRALCFYKQFLYVSSIRGLAKVGPEGPQEILDDVGQSLGYVYSLHVGPDEHLWIATLGRGLWRFDGKVLARMHEQNIPDYVNIYSLCHSDVGELFIAHDNRISKIDRKGTFVPLIDTDEPIAAWSIQSLPDGRLVAGSSTGLTIYDTTTGNIENKLSGHFDDVPWEFTTSRSLAVLDKNTVYCGLGSGLRTVHLQELAKLEFRPTASLAYTSWRGVVPDHNREGAISVLHGNWHLEIGIRTCWYLDDCVMRERLVGFEDDWSRYKGLHPVKYTALSPGNYTLEVEVRSPLAGVGPICSVLSFEVK